MDHSSVREHSPDITEPVKEGPGEWSVRLADPSTDAAAILAGAWDFIARTDFQDPLPKTDEELIEALAFMFGIGLEITVAEFRGEIVGGIGMLYTAFPWNPKLMAASEQFIWTAKDAPNTTLLRMWRFVDERKRVRRVTVDEAVCLTTSPAHIGRFYKSRGFRKVQESWARML